MDGIILINKPPNFTSFDIVAIMKKLTKAKKVGHAGTLDPLATGVLPILIGKATKVQEIFLNKTKEYIATFQLGIETDSEDITGQIFRRSAVPDLDKKDIEGILKLLLGKQEQTPPMYSAVKQNGQRLYTLARKGLVIPRSKRSIEIKNIQLIDYNAETKRVTISTTCSKGTYVRTLCADIGKKLGCGATLTALERIRSGPFYLKDCITLDAAKDYCKKGILHQHIMPIECIFGDYNCVNLTFAQGNRFKNGGNIDLNRVSIEDYRNSEIFKVYAPKSPQSACSYDFLGLGKINLENNELMFFKLLKS